MSPSHAAKRSHQRKEEEDTFLPKIAEKLVHVRAMKPNSTRYPVCGTHYLFRETYEYLATGSKDRQTLERLSDDEVAKL